MLHFILAINPGSTSTKIAVYEDRKNIFTTTLRHTTEELAGYEKITDQIEFRKNTIVKALKENGLKTSDLSIIVGRGGLLKPIASGVYEVNEAMIEDLKSARYGEHASNLGGIIAYDLAKDGENCKAYIADPVVVDEMSPVARVSGHPLFPRLSIFHALNQKAIAKTYSESINRRYDEINLIVAHLGGGVSVGTHEKGKVIDVNNALNGEGPFSPERSGTLPAFALAQACFSGRYTLADIKKIITGEGGLVAHLGTNSFQEVDQRVSLGDKKAIAIADAFNYNVAKAIGASATVLSGKVDAILITGGIAYGKELMENLSKRVEFIAPVKIYPGEDEMGALAMNGLAILSGKENPLLY